MSLDERVAELAHLALTGPESERADNFYSVISLIAKTDEPHKRADCVDRILDRIFYLMPACEAAKAARRNCQIICLLLLCGFLGSLPLTSKRAVPACHVAGFQTRLRRPRISSSGVLADQAAYPDTPQT